MFACQYNSCFCFWFGSSSPERAGASTISLARFLNVLAPPLCGLCKAPIADAGRLCAACAKDIALITQPSCARCGWPFPFATETSLQCGPCLSDPPPFTLGRSAFAYQGSGRKLILKHKHGDGLFLTPLLVNLLTSPLQELLKDFPNPLLIPVPLHWTRLFARQYNQTAEIARLLARKHRLEWSSSMLRRIRATPSQGFLSPVKRRSNVQGVFQSNSPIANHSILLLDDVWTTGATLSSATRALLASGAREVRVLTVARVLKG